MLVSGIPDLVRRLKAELATVSEGVAPDVEIPVSDVHTIPIQPLEDVLHQNWN